MGMLGMASLVTLASLTFGSGLQNDQTPIKTFLIHSDVEVCLWIVPPWWFVCSVVGRLRARDSSDNSGILRHIYSLILLFVLLKAW